MSSEYRAKGDPSQRILSILFLLSACTAVSVIIFAHVSTGSDVNFVERIASEEASEAPPAGPVPEEMPERREPTNLIDNARTDFTTYFDELLAGERENPQALAVG